MVSDDHTHFAHAHLERLREEARVHRLLRGRTSWRRTLGVVLLRLAVKVEPDLAPDVRLGSARLEPRPMPH